MPHFRQRYLTELLKKTLRYSPITGIFGHRQVGKTTLANLLAGQYATLDQSAQQDQASQDPDGFLKSRNTGKTPLVIDECQLAPPLFPVLKEWVRTHVQPGQFLLTGSVRFSSRKAIKESLTGRMIAWELIPLGLSEIHGQDMPKGVLRLAQSRHVNLDIKSQPYFSHKSFSEYLRCGGLPGIFAIRDAGIREQKIETQLNTMLERDLKLILQTTVPYRSLRLLLALLAKSQGMPVEWAALSQQSRISVPTVKKLVEAFEAMFLIRLLPTRGSETKIVMFLEDQGEASFLMEGQRQELYDLLRFCFANLRTQLSYQTAVQSTFFQYRNRGGAHIPLALELRTKETKRYLGLIPILDTTPTPHDLGSAYSFLKTFSSSKVLFVTLEDVDRVLSPVMRVIFVGKIV